MHSFFLLQFPKPEGRRIESTNIVKRRSRFSTVARSKRLLCCLGHGHSYIIILTALMQSTVRHDERAVTGDIAEGDASPPEWDRVETESVPRILSVLSYVLERLVTRNEQCAPPTYVQLNKSLTAFHGLRAPAITVAKYLERIYKYTSCSPSCFVVGYIYIDRLVHRQPDLPVISLNIHRLLVTSVMVAAKLFDDVHYNNAFFARVGGVSNAELNRLELELLFRLDFRLKVTGNVFESYCSHLEKEMLCGTAGMRIQRDLPSSGKPKGVSCDEEESKVRLPGVAVVRL